MLHSHHHHENTLYDSKEHEKLALKTSYVTMFLNALLTIFKLIAGVIGHSSAMISDGIHSASDVGSTIIVIFGVKLGAKQADKEHPYGHERFENISAIILAGLLLGVGFSIGKSGVMVMVTKAYLTAQIPTILPLMAALLSIGIKEWMYWYTRNTGKILQSNALMADAWHHRSDALSSIGALIGIAGARIGFPILDPLASIIISICIIKVAIDLLLDSFNQLLDKACDQETLDKITAIIQQHSEVIKIDLIHTRLFSSKIFVDIEITLNGTDTLKNTHDIADTIQHEVETQIDNVKQCMIHVNPS